MARNHDNLKEFFHPLGCTTVLEHVVHTPSLAQFILQHFSQFAIVYLFLCFIFLISVPDTAWALSVSFWLTFLLKLLMQQPTVCRCGLQAPFLTYTIYLLLSLPPLSGMISGTSWPIPKCGTTKEFNNTWNSLCPWGTTSGYLRQQAWDTF